MTALHDAITGHPHWRAFDDEEAKARRLLAKSQEHDARVAAARRDHDARLRAWEDEHESALLDGRDPDPSARYPGEFVAPSPLLGRRQPVEVAHDKLGQVESMRRSWAARKAPELVPALAEADARSVRELRRGIGAMREAVSQGQTVRESLGWLAACGADSVPVPTGLFEIANLLSALEDALGRVVAAGDAGTAIPSDLDGVDIG